MLNVYAPDFVPEYSLTEEQLDFLEEEMFYTYTDKELFYIEEEEELFYTYTEEENEFLEKAHKEADLIVKLLDEADTVFYPINTARMAYNKAVNAAIAARAARTGM